jgi:predicted dehydrogenase
MKTIGFGIVGTGAIADFHARALAAISGASLLGVTSSRPDARNAFASRHQTQAAHSLDELLALPGLDAVTIATPSGSHTEVALAAFRAGKHVLCEKPLDVTLEKVDAMIAEADRRGLLLGAIFQQRFGAGVRKLKAAIESGRFGRLTLCSCSLKWWRSQDYYDQGQWRGTKALDGGGALFNQGIHAVDLLQWLVGFPVEVQAYTATLAHERVEVEDLGVALLKFPSGALGVIEASTATWPGFSRRIEISGDRGSAILEDDRLTFWEFADKLAGDDEVTAFSPSSLGSGASDPAAIGIEGHRLQLEDFVAAIREQRQPSIRGADARNSVRLVLAIYKAAVTNRPVRLD